MRWYDGRPVDWDGHLVLVHEGERQRRIGVAAWVQRGLDLGAKILYTEPPGEVAERSLMGILRDNAVQFDEALERGRLQILAAKDEVYDPTWQEEVVDEALRVGYPTVRWSGEARTAWGVISPSAHADSEWETDRLCHERRVSILCQYPAHLPQATLQTVFAMHGAGLREALLATAPTPDGIALAGAVDASNHRILRSVLVAAIARVDEYRKTFVVELSGLEFIDVSGARALHTGTTDFRIRGGQVSLRGAGRSVESVLRLLGVDRSDGFRVADAS